MAKTANLYVRIDPEIKEEAEMILDSLGIPMSNAVSMFLRQVIMQRGIPFEIKLPDHPLDISKMTKEELDAELEKGYRDIVEGRTFTADEVEKMFHEKRKNRK